MRYFNILVCKNNSELYLPGVLLRPSLNRRLVLRLRKTKHGNGIFFQFSSVSRKFGGRKKAKVKRLDLVRETSISLYRSFFCKGSS